MDAAARPLPDHAHRWGPLAGERAEGGVASAAPTSGVWRSALRWLRDAAIGLAIITSVPLVAIAARGYKLHFNETGLAAKIAQVEPLRVLRLPATGELSPLAAGQLWHATDAVRRTGAFPMLPARPPAERSWENLSLDEGTFAGVRRLDRHLLQSPEAIRLAAGTLSEAEREYLRTIADAPIWRDIDRLASAEAVDMVGARYVLPFRAEASPELMPIPRFAATKEIVYASLARAAHHVAQGEPDRAEQALRSALSYGFVMLDNGHTSIEGLLGRVMVGIASDGLHTLYTLTGNAAGAALTAPMADEPAVTPAAPVGTTEERLIAIAGDPSVARTVRLESLYRLAFSSCTSVRRVLFGPSDASNAAFDDARRTLARYPSELALIDLLQVAPDRPTAESEIKFKGDWLLLGAASVASTVLNTPRIQACTRVLNAYR
jgi:hypothetical protein